MSETDELAEYLASERVQLCRAISEHKWYLSERAGYDVGYQVAEQHFIEHILPSFANEFRMNYCQSCHVQNQCITLSNDSEILKAS